MQRQAPHRLFLADLTHGPTADAICVRVMRKWLYDGGQFGVDAQYIGFVLADEKGDYIYGHIAARHMETKSPLVQLDKTYLIKKFSVRPSKKQHVPFIKKSVIEFSGLTVVVPVRDPHHGFPEYVYNITAFSELNPVYPHSAIYIDVLGAITSVGNVVEQRVKQKMVPMRELFIKNEGNEELKVTLWADQAVNFKLPDTSTSNPIQSIVVLFVGCVPKSMNLKTQVNGGYGCRWFFNPNIKEAQPLYQSLQSTPVPVYQSPAADTSSQHQAAAVIPQHVNLEDINSKDPYNFTKEGYKVTVTVTSIPEEKKWWYLGYARCRKSIKEETDNFICDVCDWRETRILYKFPFVAEDETAEGQFFHMMWQHAMRWSCLVASAFHAGDPSVIRRGAAPTSQIHVRPSPASALSR